MISAHSCSTHTLDVMTANIINGKEVATLLRNQIQLQIQQRLQEGKHAPGLAVVLVGQDAASEVYVKNKRLACNQTGIKSFNHDLPATTSQQELLQLIEKLNNDPEVNGILVQLPLPKHIDTETVLDAIRPDKDVDGFHPYNLGRLAQKRPLLRSCTPYGIIKLLEHYQLPLKGLDAVVVGASNIVGRPMALELLNARCTVTVCHSATKDLQQKVTNADLLVVAVGNPKVVDANWIKPGAIVIDVGIHRCADGSLCGDIDYAVASKIAGWITPVPGGVGPMTVTMLLHNTLLAAEKH